MSNGLPIRCRPAPLRNPHPYRAVICGEEHVVKGWKDGNIVTDKGEYIFQRLQGRDVEAEWAGELGSVRFNYSFNCAYVMEVATLRANKRGEWLLNNQKLDTLLCPPTGIRLHDLKRSEVLQLRKNEIKAVAWVQTVRGGNSTVEIDLVLRDWRDGKRRRPAKQPGEVNWHGNFFAGWSKPVWLTSFQIAEMAEDVCSSTPHGQKPTASPIPRPAKSHARFESEYSIAVIHDGSGNKATKAVPRGLRKMIQEIMKSNGQITRQLLINRLRPAGMNQKSNYQPDKLFKSSKIAQALQKVGLIGKNKESGNEVIYWAKIESE